MLIAISLLILAYMIMGKDISRLLEKVKNVDWRGKITALMDKLRPWALKAYLCCHYLHHYANGFDSQCSL